MGKEDFDELLKNDDSFRSFVEIVSIGILFRVALRAGPEVVMKLASNLQEIVDHQVLNKTIGEQVPVKKKMGEP